MASYLSRICSLTSQTSGDVTGVPDSFHESPLEGQQEGLNDLEAVGHVASTPGKILRR